MREVVVTPETVDKGHEAVVEVMRAAGFRFIALDELSGHASAEPLPDGSVRWRQWYDA